ncbi:DUF21 domain-containing protein [archaeon]|nr:MAG: DUF21 domain-containing protein [archaeon]
MGERQVAKILAVIGVLVFLPYCEAFVLRPLQFQHRKQVYYVPCEKKPVNIARFNREKLFSVNKNVHNERNKRNWFIHLVHSAKHTPSNLVQHINPRQIARFMPLCLLVITFLFIKKAIASVGLPANPLSKLPPHPVRDLLTWALLFSISAVMHSAESAITKISPWKVQQFAEEEGPTSPFATLNKNITRMLITILLTTTACSIYSTALFVTSMSALFPRLSLGFITAALTVITLFCGELLPKALAVSNSELVARKIVPVLARMTSVLTPFTTSVTVLSSLVLRLTGEYCAYPYPYT